MTYQSHKPDHFSGLTPCSPFWVISLIKPKDVWTLPCPAWAIFSSSKNGEQKECTGKPLVCNHEKFCITEILNRESLWIGVNSQSFACLCNSLFTLLAKIYAYRILIWDLGCWNMVLMHRKEVLEWWLLVLVSYSYTHNGALDESTKKEHVNMELEPVA